jgi:type II secretory pathway pseudopilin PulG
MKSKNGFTIIELLVVALFGSLLLILFFVQKSNIDAMNRDDMRKTAINAMYYALEESFYKQNGYYPETISEENITVIDPALWTDPLGFNLGDPLSSYSYEPANCSQGKCKEYILKADLEKEDTYIKYNRTHTEE